MAALQVAPIAGRVATYGSNDAPLSCATYRVSPSGDSDGSPVAPPSASSVSSRGAPNWIVPSRQRDQQVAAGASPPPPSPPPMPASIGSIPNRPQPAIET